MADRNMKLALLLTAQDKLSMVVRSAVDSSIKDFKRMDESTKNINKVLDGALGYGMIKAGKKGLSLIGDTVKQFADFETEASFLKANLMDSNGFLDPNLWEQVNKKAIELGNELPGNTADFYKMFNTMIKYGTDAKDVVNGLGEATAYTALITGQSYDEVAAYTNKLRNVTGVATKDFEKFFDVLQRADKSGAKFGELTMAFSRVGPGLKFLGIQGLEDSTKMAGLFAMNLIQGASPERLGTNFNRLFMEMLQPEKHGKMREAAKSFGKDLNFLNDKGGFAGIDNFIAQLRKLEGLNQSQINTIFKGLTGAEGMDDQLVKMLSTGGLKDYDKIMEKMFGKASIGQQKDMLLSTLNAQWEQFKGTVENIKASIGEQFKGELLKLLKVINSLTAGLANLIKEHPGLTKLLASLMAFGSVALIFMGVVKVVRGLGAAIGILKLTGLITNVSALNGAGAMLNGTLMGTVGLLGKYFFWVTLIVGVVENWDTKIKILGEDLGTVGELIWNIVKPLVQLAAVIDQIGTDINNLIGLTSDEDARIENNSFRNFIVETDQRFRDKELGYGPKTAASNQTFNYNPTIQVGAGATPEAVAKATQESRKVFEDGMRQFLKEQERKRY